MTRTETAPRHDWRTAIPGTRRRHMRAWLWSVAAMTFAVLVIGGITRLTLSGLSIVEWKPFSGVIPPIGNAEWKRTFEMYQQFPEYQTWRSSMTLVEFKSIFMWEYLHRLAARAIGLVFLVPFLFFWMRGYFNRQLLGRSIVLFGLGMMQGVIGWFMVRSGLVDRPSVSHYRLAAHLSLAFAIAGYAIWLALDLQLAERRVVMQAASRRALMRGLCATGVILVLQILWGAFVAGLKAGHLYPTFPLMGGRLIPPDLVRLDPFSRNFVENASAVQWVHRVIGTVLCIVSIALFVRVRTMQVDQRSARFGTALLALIFVQYLLGVLTVVRGVPVQLGVTHQATAVIIFALWLSWVHHVHNTEPSIQSI